jgi:hypothetical protein
MFKRLKNLIELSRYSADDFFRVEGVHARPGETMNDYYERTWGEPVTTVSDATYVYGTDGHLAQIIDLKEEDPFKDLQNDTPEQPPEDTATRNG